MRIDLAAGPRFAVSTVFQIILFGCLLISVSFGPGQVWGQNENTYKQNPSTAHGPQPFATFATPTESISGVNGNVMVSIPLLHLSGVNGLDLDLSLNYNSKMAELVPWYQVDQQRSSLYWAFNNSRMTLGRGILSIPTLRFENVYEGEWPGGPDGETYHIFCDSAFLLTDSGGATHSFTNRRNCADDGYVNPSLPHWDVSDSQDSDVIRLDTNNPADVHAIMKNGVVLHFDITSSANSYPTSIVDPYGNRIAIVTDAQNNLTITDTVGRIVTITKGSGYSGTISYNDSNGISRQITITETISTGNNVIMHANSSCINPGFTLGFSGEPLNADFGANTYQETITFEPGGANLQYIATLDSAWEPIKLAYPQGGYTRYDYHDVQGVYNNGDWVCGNFQIREVAHKYTCAASSGSCSPEDITTYTEVATHATNDTMTITEPADDQGHQRRTVSTFSSSNDPDAAPLEINRKVFDNISTLLMETVTQYQTTLGGPSQPSDVTTKTYTASGVLSSRVHYTYEPLTVRYQGWYSNDNWRTIYLADPASITVYDFSGSAIRSTTNTWKRDNGSFSLSGGHILDRLQSSTTTGPLGVSRTQTMEYYPGGGLSSTATSGSDVAALTTSYTVDAHGRRLTETDPKLAVTHYTYDDPWNGSAGGCGSNSGLSPLPSSIENDLHQVTTLHYFPCTGLTASVTDSNHQTTSYTYDPIGRVHSVTLPESTVGAGHGGTTFSYSNNQTQADTLIQSSSIKGSTASPNSTTVLSSVSVADGLGRVIDQQTLQVPECFPAGITHRVTRYDAMGRTASTSNPSCSATSGPATDFAYDALDRPTVTVLADTVSKTQVCYNGLSTDSRQINCLAPDGGTLTGPYSDSMDAAGVRLQHTGDALGNLVHVAELGNTADPRLLRTNYSYDDFGNLVLVNQLGNSAPNQTTAETPVVRRFQYDSIGRLAWECNPEGLPASTFCDGIHWSKSYQYDPSSNVAAITNSRGITVHYGYDTLNRLTSKSYTGNTSTASSVAANTAPAQYFYDQASYNTLPITNGIGRRTGMSDGEGMTAWSYDGLGQVGAFLRKSRWLFSAVYHYTYNLNGSPDVTYGAKHLYDSVGRESATGPVVETRYTPAGAIAWQKLGTTQAGTVITQNQYNSLLQPSVLTTNATLGQDYGGFSYTVQSLSYGYAVGANNGNITDVVDNLNSLRSQHYAYDGLNRLASASATNWTQTPQYDSFGNMTSMSTSFGFQSGVVPGKNQLSSYSYDDAGNMISDGSQIFTYDAENRISRIGTVVFGYDGDGQRVVRGRANDPDEEQTEFVWRGPDGRTIEEVGPDYFSYAYFGNRMVYMNDGDEHYPVSDHLGTNHLLLGEEGYPGQVESFYPFGQSINPGYVPNQHYKFTDQERDVDTRLDYRRFRYYNSNIGRWMTPDPSSLELADLDDPRSLNLYSYVLNSPVILEDPDGLQWECTSSTILGGDSKPSPMKCVHVEDEPDKIAESKARARSARPPRRQVDPATLVRHKSWDADLPSCLAVGWQHLKRAGWNTVDPSPSLSSAATDLTAVAAANASLYMVTKARVYAALRINTKGGQGLIRPAGSAPFRSMLGKTGGFKNAFGSAGDFAKVAASAVLFGLDVNLIIEIRDEIANPVPCK